MRPDTFGELYSDIILERGDWSREVIECSRSCCVCVLFVKKGVKECVILENICRMAAIRHKHIKFIQINISMVNDVEDIFGLSRSNWPKRSLPAIQLFAQGSLRDEVFTLKSFGGSTATCHG